jgi:hypothetical protein
VRGSAWRGSCFVWLVSYSSQAVKRYTYSHRLNWVWKARLLLTYRISSALVEAWMGNLRDDARRVPRLGVKGGALQLELVGRTLQAELGIVRK